MVVQTSFDGKLCAEAPMHKSCKVMESELFPRLMLQYKDVQGLMPPTLVVPVPHASTCHIHIISLFQFDHRPPKPGTDLGIRWDPMGSDGIRGSGRSLCNIPVLPGSLQLQRFGHLCWPVPSWQLLHWQPKEDA